MFWGTDNTLKHCTVIRNFNVSHTCQGFWRNTNFKQPLEGKCLSTNTLYIWPHSTCAIEASASHAIVFQTLCLPKTTKWQITIQMVALIIKVILNGYFVQFCTTHSNYVKGHQFPLSPKTQQKLLESFQPSFNNGQILTSPSGLQLIQMYLSSMTQLTNPRYFQQYGEFEHAGKIHYTLRNSTITSTWHQWESFDSFTTINYKKVIFRFSL